MLRAMRSLRLSIALCLVLCGPASAQVRAGDVPLADVLEVLVLDGDVVAIDANGGGQRTLRLRLNERVHWTGSRGKVGVVLTDQRILAVATGSGAWQQLGVLRDEPPPVDALLGDRVALVMTTRRAIGFDGNSGNLVESSLGLKEVVLATRAGENVAIVVTDRRALGLSPAVGGFFQAKIGLREKVESVTAGANLATIVSDRRILVFRATTGSFEERLRTLN